MVAFQDSLRFSALQFLEETVVLFFHFVSIVLLFQLKYSMRICNGNIEEIKHQEIWESELLVGSRLRTRQLLQSGQQKEHHPIPKIKLRVKWGPNGELETRNDKRAPHSTQKLETQGKVCEEWGFYFVPVINRNQNTTFSIGPLGGPTIDLQHTKPSSNLNYKEDSWSLGHYRSCILPGSKPLIAGTSSSLWESEGWFQPRLQVLWYP